MLRFEKLEERIPACGVGGVVGGLDVNGDHHVTPADVLIIINEVNDPDSFPRPAADIDRNGFVTPIDALIVLNYLNQDKGEGFIPWHNPFWEPMLGDQELFREGIL